ncbi:hypothetical protein [Corynebacterium sp. P8-C1]|uniref:hypothetical protein n=1 Tax=Corynebacterium sp. P8-C1 TaxID=3059082 RepID=UPI00265CA057|nr:hypothetical protein [Corynebacterium sp. P8-C1]WKK64318.1 hypothetical protein QYR04_05425 [Corynebacterium sp. P8-C1]
MADRFGGTAVQACVPIFVGRGRFGAALRQALQDLEALHLIGRAIWVDLDAFTGPMDHALLIDGRVDGTPSTTDSFARLLASGYNERFALCVVNAQNGEDNVREMDLQVVADTVAELNPLPVNVLAGRAGESTSPEVDIVRGYVNLFIAPEESDAPSDHSVPVSAGERENTFTLLVATTLCSLFGLWDGASECPVEQLRGTASPIHFRLTRAYFRRVDGEEVQNQLRQALFDTEVNPRPRLNRADGGTAVVEHPQNREQFSRAAADEFLGLYRDGLMPKRVAAKTDRDRELSNKEASRELRGMWWKTLINTPANSFNDLRGGASDQISASLQRVYGADSSAVIGSMRNLQGAPAQISQEAQQIDRNKVAAEMQPMWNGYKNFALTMLDAKPRPLAPMARDSATPQVVRQLASDHVTVAASARDVIPAPEQAMRIDDPSLRDVMGTDSLAPYDPEAIATYEQRLNSADTNGVFDTGKLHNDFERWRSTERGSFARYIGDELRNIRVQCEQQVAAARAELERLSRGVKAPETGAAARTCRFLGWVTTTSLFFFLIFWLIGHLVMKNAQDKVASGEGSFTDLVFSQMWWVQNLNNASSSTLAWMFGIWVFIWLIFFLLQVSFETRDQAQLANLRKGQRARIEAAQQTLRNAEVSLVRLEEAYPQFLSVTQLLGELVNRPFGRVKTERNIAAQPSNRMPRNVVFADAAPEAGAVSNVVAHYKNGLYHEGWLGDAVSAGLTRAYGELFQPGNDDRWEYLSAQRGKHSSSPLDRIARYVTSPEFSSSDRTGDKWRPVAEELRASNNPFSGQLLGTVSSGDSGHARALEGELLGDAAHGTFSSHFLASASRGRAASAVDGDLSIHRVSSSPRDPVGRTEVLVQVGGNAQAQDITLSSAGSAATDHSDDIVLPGSGYVEDNYGTGREMPAAEGHSTGVSSRWTPGPDGSSAVDFPSEGDI